MKNLIKATTLAALMGFSVNAMAVPGETATGTFQWAGNIPAANSDGRFQIVKTGSVDHDAGLLLFKASDDGLKYEVASSSELRFGVVDTQSGEAVSKFGYSLNRLEFATSSNQFMKAVDDQFVIHANDDVLTTTAVTADNGEVRLLVASGSEGLNAEDYTGGDQVIVMATILVSDIEI